MIIRQNPAAHQKPALKIYMKVIYAHIWQNPLTVTVFFICALVGWTSL